MNTTIFLSVVFSILAIMDLRVFLFQRTVRKIRQYAYGSNHHKAEASMYPFYYTLIFWLSKLRYIALVWLLFINWMVAIGLFVLWYKLAMWLPVNDWKNTQKIKKFLQHKFYSRIATDDDFLCLEWVEAAEAKMKDDEAEENNRP